MATKLSQIEFTFDRYFNLSKAYGSRNGFSASFASIAVDLDLDRGCHRDECEPWIGHGSRREAVASCERISRSPRRIDENSRRNSSMPTENPRIDSASAAVFKASAATSGRYGLKTEKVVSDLQERFQRVRSDYFHVIQILEIRPTQAPARLLLVGDHV